jgi:two-component system response regulator MprA
MTNTALRVLLVNDDLFFSPRILSVLKNMGHEASTANTVEQALQKMAADKPDLIIFNLNSQRLGGMETIRRLKSEGGAPRLLAFLSHVKIPDIREEVLAAGADKLCANSAITMRLPDIVNRVMNSSPAADDAEDEE